MARESAVDLGRIDDVQYFNPSVVGDIAIRIGESEFPTGAGPLAIVRHH